MMPRTVLLLLGVSASLAAASCAQFPELDRAVSPEAEAAPFPVLIASAPILADAAQPGPATEVPDDLGTRADALRARGTALTASDAGVDAETRRRIAEGQARLAEERARREGDGSGS